MKLISTQPKNVPRAIKTKIKFKEFKLHCLFRVIWFTFYNLVLKINRFINLLILPGFNSPYQGNKRPLACRTRTKTNIYLQIWWAPYKYTSCQIF